MHNLFGFLFWILELIFIFFICSRHVILISYTNTNLMANGMVVYVWASVQVGSIINTYTISIFSSTTNSIHGFNFQFYWWGIYWIFGALKILGEKIMWKILIGICTVLNVMRIVNALANSRISCNIILFLLNIYRA